MCPDWAMGTLKPAGGLLLVGKPVWLNGLPTPLQAPLHVLFGIRRFSKVTHYTLLCKIAFS